MALLPKLVTLIQGYAAEVNDANTASESGLGALGARAVHPRAALSCLRVLCAVSRRAPWAAARVASERGLLEGVREVRGHKRGWERGGCGLLGHTACGLLRV